MAKPIVAILYDFDSTLAKKDMQDFGFVPALGMTPAEFWAKTGEFSAKTGADRILSYLYVMKKAAEEKGIKMTKEWLNEMGKNIKFFPGVETWFQRINDYGKAHGLQVEHYLISSGNKEIVDGCAIAKEFTKMYACEYLFDENGEIYWPKLTINFTQKTQYFFRIAKGVTDVSDDQGLNEKTPNKRIPYSNIIYIGDGMTDVPAMILAKNNGGKSIAVYKQGCKEKVAPLYNEGRVNYMAFADYREGKQLEKLMKLIIKGIEIAEELGKHENKEKPQD
ncbi:MAG: haloacid dehalogenase-like hydrolase [Bacilli bacterium]|nr:haloacid dehalogenase-like hydrolase [Bacilli bacterium]